MIPIETPPLEAPGTGDPLVGAHDLTGMQDELWIRPGQGLSDHAQDLWRYRQLFYFLAWRDILVRYKQTVMGIAWSVLRPTLTMLVFTVVFGMLAGMPSDGAPYPVLVFCAMLPWQMFVGAVNESSNSIINNSALITKVYFPRMIVPTSAVIVSLVDFVIAFAILGVLMAFYGHVPTLRVLWLPAFLLLALVAALGLGLLTSALTVKYRDFRYVIPFLGQLGLYVSPVGFSSAVIPDSWRLLYSVNPMVGVIDGFRWAILEGDRRLFLPGLWLAVLLSLLMFVGGVLYFRRVERSFADVI